MNGDMISENITALYKGLKVQVEPVIARNIGIEVIREKCSHFNV